MHMHAMARPWAAAGLACLIAACSGPPGPEDAGSFDAHVVDASCPAGQVGCACDVDDGCASGACVGGECVDCDRGREGCACRSDMTCSAGSLCDVPTGICVACEAGEQGCACGAGCAGGLVCEAGVCVPDTCRDGEVACPCAEGDPACEAGAFCDGTLCQACTAETVGCPCEDGACGGGLVCDAGACREPIGCDALRAAGGCGEHERCDEPAGADAVCSPGECVAGYRWSAVASACVVCASAGCAAEPTCEPGLPTSLDCGAAHRVCVTSDGAGECADCEAGYADVGGTCVEAELCGGAVCTAAQYCDRTDPSAPSCVTRPCGTGDAVQRADGTCGTCSRACAGPGYTGRIWPFTDLNDVCVCETRPGWYFEAGTVSAAAQCDADGDGWVRAVVGDIVDGGDPALVANARCAVRSADAVVLVDEYGTESVIESCVQGLLQDRGGAGACDVFPLRLFETKRNDVAGEAELILASTGVDEAPPYATRRFRVNELNSLTKACVSPVGDFDDDGREDLVQVQPRPENTATLANERDRLRAFAHFVELYRTSWRPSEAIPPEARPDRPADWPYGRIVIAERSRCSVSTFPLGYGTDTRYASDPMDADDGPSYWRNCTRRRPRAFNAASTAPGSDFGQWVCGARTGTCDLPPVPANATHVTLPDPSEALVRDHGVCELAGAPPADGVWRGMLHHSQFQCVHVVSNTAATVLEHQRRQQAFSTVEASTLVYNRCRLIQCASPIGCTESVGPAAPPGAWDPRLLCDHTVGDAPVVDSVGWAAVRYRPYGHVGLDGTIDELAYESGCINEDAEYTYAGGGEVQSYLCPSPEYGRCTTAPTDAFGRYHCYGWDSMFLWGTESEGESPLRRNVLAWAPDPAPDLPDNMSVFGPEPGPGCD